MPDLTLRGQCEEAIRRMRADEPEAAMMVCRRILETFPKHVGTYSILGQATLQMGEHEEAANLFRRVLSADPEHTLSYASLGAIYAERGLLDEAIWQLERAFELSPGNGEIRRELGRLYSRRSMAQITRLHMTRAGLARTYLRGQLYPKAIGELRELVAAEPHRFDLRVALAEALWQDDRYEDASVVCQGILVDLPNCLKANLILGQIWLNTEKDEEGRALLQRAQTLDPENSIAQTLFGARSALPPRMPRLPFRESDAPPPLALPYLLDEEEVVTEAMIIDAEVATPRPADVPTPVPQEAVAEEASEAEKEPVADLEPPELIPVVPEMILFEREEIEALPTEESQIEPLAEVVPVEELDVADEAILAPLQEHEADELVIGPIIEEAPAAESMVQEPEITEPATTEVLAEGVLAAPSWIDLQREYVAQHPHEIRAHLDLARLLWSTGAIAEAVEQYGLLCDRDAETRPQIVRDLQMMNRLHPGHQALVELLFDAQEQVAGRS